MRRILGTVVVAAAVAACTATGVTSQVGSGSPVPSVAVTAPPAPSAESPVPSVAVTAPPVSPSAAIALSLPKTFKSKQYGYTMSMAADWTAKAATLLVDDPKSTGDTGTDVITVAGTDTTIPVVAWDLGHQTFAAWLEDYRAAMSSGVPAGCDGGDPSTWPKVAIGALQGVWQQKCNAAVATVEHAGKAYQFAWENSTFEGSKHLSETDFKAVLASVKFR